MTNCVNNSVVHGYASQGAQALSQLGCKQLPYTGMTLLVWVVAAILLVVVGGFLLWLSHQ